MSISKTASLAVLTFATVVLAPTGSYAAYIDGSKLSINVDSSVGPNFLNWICDQAGDAACPRGANVGDFSVVNTSTGSFAAYLGGYGTIKDLTNAGQPLNTPFLLVNFMVFDLNSNAQLDLTFIPLGNDTPSATCSGLQHCTPIVAPFLCSASNPACLSAFNLDQNVTGTTASFGVFGTVHDAAHTMSANYSGTFSATFTGQSPAQVLASVGPNGTPTVPGGGQFILTIVPEPVTLSLVGAGLLGFGVWGRRRRRS